MNQRLYLFRKQDRFEEQVAALTQACTLQPSKAYPRYLLSIAYRLSAEIHETAGSADQAKDDYGKALTYALKAQQVEPQSPWGYMCEGDYWESRRDYEAALTAYDRSEPYCAFESEDARVVLFQYRWRLRYWTRRFDLASQDLERLAKVSPAKDSRRAWYEFFFPALIAAETGHPDIAASLAQDMPTKTPADFRAVTSAASLLRILGRSKEADDLLVRHRDRINYESESAAPPAAPPDWARLSYVYCQESASQAAMPALPADRPDRRRLLAASHFFHAAAQLGLGNRASARGAFQECERAYDNEQYCYLAAVIGHRLEKDSGWPPWIPTPGAP